MKPSMIAFHIGSHPSLFLSVVGTFLSCMEKIVFRRIGAPHTGDYIWCLLLIPASSISINIRRRFQGDSSSK